MTSLLFVSIALYDFLEENIMTKLLYKYIYTYILCYPIISVIIQIQYAVLSSHFCYHTHTIFCVILSLYPPKRSLGGGILDSPCSSVRLSVCPSVRLSVRPSVRPWVGVRMITLILFSGFKKILVDISLGSWSCLGLNISVLPH